MLDMFHRRARKAARARLLNDLLIGTCTYSTVIWLEITRERRHCGLYRYYIRPSHSSMFRRVCLTVRTRMSPHAGLYYRSRVCSTLF